MTAEVSTPSPLEELNQPLKGHIVSKGRHVIIQSSTAQQAVVTQAEDLGLSFKVMALGFHGNCSSVPPFAQSEDETSKHAG